MSPEISPDTGDMSVTMSVAAASFYNSGQLLLLMSLVIGRETLRINKVSICCVYLY